MKSLETWASGDAYEFYMGRWSEQIAELFLHSLDIKAATWLDIGAGTGALTRKIAQQNPKALLALDLSFDFLQYAKQSLKTEFINGSALVLPFANASFDTVVSGLALNFVPKPEDALHEFVRVAKSAGIIAAYVWDYADKMEFLRYFWDAAVSLNPEAKSLHEGYRFPICQAEALRTLWEGAGLKNVSVQALDTSTVFENFEAYWEIFSFGKFPAPQYLASLDEKSRQALHDAVEAAIPKQSNHSIHLIARAWAVYGEKAL